MFGLHATLNYYLYEQVCDMRKSFDGLSGLVRNCLGQSPTNGDVFIFLNKRRNMLKLLHWEGDGFVLYYKRLEQGTFTRPELSKNKQAISWSDLALMVAGIEVIKSRQKPRFSLPK